LRWNNDDKWWNWWQLNDLAKSRATDVGSQSYDDDDDDDDEDEDDEDDDDDDDESSSSSSLERFTNSDTFAPATAFAPWCLCVERRRFSAGVVEVDVSSAISDDGVDASDDGDDAITASSSSDDDDDDDDDDEQYDESRSNDDEPTVSEVDDVDDDESSSSPPVYDVSNKREPVESSSSSSFVSAGVKSLGTTFSSTSTNASRAACAASERPIQMRATEMRQ